MKKKQTFLSETLKLKSREDHKSHSSNTSKVITSLKSSKVQQ